MKHGHNFVPLKQAVHSFEAESEKELSLAVGDFVVVRKVVYFILKFCPFFFWPLFLKI